MSSGVQVIYRQGQEAMIMNARVPYRGVSNLAKYTFRFDNFCNSRPSSMFLGSLECSRQTEHRSIWKSLILFKKWEVAKWCIDPSDRTPLAASSTDSMAPISCRKRMSSPKKVVAHESLFSEMSATAIAVMCRAASVPSWSSDRFKRWWRKT